MVAAMMSSRWGSALHLSSPVAAGAAVDDAGRVVTDMTTAGVLRAAMVVWLLLGGAQAGADHNVIPVDAGQFRETIAAERGHVVLVNFWATWCRPCLKEIPVLTKLARQYHAQGLRLVAVSLDEPGDLDGVVKPFLAKFFPDFRTYVRLAPDMDGMVSVIDPAWNELLPTSYVLDRQGVVKSRLQGGKTASEFEAAVKDVLAAR